MVETAVTIPVMVLLIGGMMLAGFYAFRSASANWGIFIAGVGAGAFDEPATGRAKVSILWPDIRGSVNADGNGNRSVKSEISVTFSRSFLFGINLKEAERGSSNLRLWRFYPGPSDGDVQ